MEQYLHGYAIVIWVQSLWVSACFSVMMFDDRWLMIEMLSAFIRNCDFKRGPSRLRVSP